MLRRLYYFVHSFLHRCLHRVGLALILVGFGVFIYGGVFGQDTLAIQDFENTPATPTWGYNDIGSDNSATSTGNGNFPVDPKFVSGSQGREVNDADATLEFDAVNTSAYSNTELSFRLASFSGTSGNGAEGTDFVLISVSDDNGASWSEELEVTGSSNNNAKWSFITGTGIASTAYDGNNSTSDFAPSSGGNQTTEGYSFIKVTDLPNVGNLKIKIQLKNNNNDEFWVIDDVVLTGTLAVTSTIVEFTSATYTQTENGTSVDLCVDITNEDGTNATTADVVLTSIAGSVLGNYSTQTVTFAAGGSTQQCISVPITDNTTCDGNQDYTFELQNVSGGNAAAAGSQSSTVLTVTDDEQTSGTIDFQGFEGSGWGYTPTPTPYNADGGDDVWDITSSLNSIPPSLGSFFWAITDLDNTNGGGSFDHELEFSSQNISSYSAVVLSFEYYTDDFNGSDILKYQISYDGNPYNSEILLNTNTDNWVVETINIPVGTTSVQLKLIANQDGPQYAGFDNIKLTGVGCFTCEEPTTQSTFFTTSPTFPDETSAEYNWTVAGNGQNRLIIVREGNAVTTDPVDGTSYPANAAFGTPGTDIEPNEYAVYNGPNHSTTITNLTPGTEYFAKIFEYNCLPGSEDYLTSGTPDTDVFITPPENPASFDEGCVGSTSLDLSWTAPANGNSDGYLLVVREGTNSPTTVTNIDPSSQIFNLDYGSAHIYDAGSGSRVLYRGTGTSVTITNLSANANYTFELYSYSVATSGWKYSDGTTTSQNIHLEDVSSLSTTPHIDNIELSWALNISCVDEIIVAASDVGAVTSAPTGLGYTVNSNSFTDGSNPALSNGEKVVYSGTGTSTTITNLTTDQEYCFKVFVRKGLVWSQGVDICETPRDITVLEPGDISIVAVNTSTDQVCFVSYKSITPNTSIDFTDNGYERQNAGKWADTEGVIRLTRTNSAPTIPKGEVICIEGAGYQQSDFTIKTCGTTDTDWSISSLNGNNAFNLNSEDQVWILQNGNWNNGVDPHEAVYTGNVLYGWTATGWKTNPGYDDPSGSTLYQNSFCLSTNLNSIGEHNDKVKYTTGLTPSKSRIDWIQSFNDYSNWTGYETNADYNSGLPDYANNCESISITPTITTAGLWTGDEDQDWFNCKNWDNLRSPDATVDATIPNVSNDPVISGPGAACYDLILDPNSSLTITDPSADLSIYGDLYVEGSLINLDGTVSFSGDTDQNISDSTATIQTFTFHNLTINKPSGKLFTDENLAVAGNAQFDSGILIPQTGVAVTFQPNATTSGASNNSFIDGKVIKEANNEDFTFPIGDIKGDTAFWYQPARIFGYTGSTTIEAQYFAEANPNAGAYYDGESNAPGDNQEISNCDYWTVNKVSGTDVKLALSYTNTDPEYCNVVGEPSALRIFSFNDAPQAMNWNEVASGNSGNEIVSNVNINAPVTGGNYGDFALGGPSPNNLNVLPITLLNFTAEAKHKQVFTQWTTSTETNNAFFTVERSADAKRFSPIGTVEGAGNSHEINSYAFEDKAPLSGVSYYRLRQTDFDGAFTFSDVRSIEFFNSGKFSLDLAYRSDDALHLAFSAEAPYLTVELFDVFGRRVFGAVVQNDAGRATVRPNLGRGVYVVRISQGKNNASKKFFW